MQTGRTGVRGANPPYKRLEEGEDETLVGRWMNEEIWPDLKQPVKDAGKGGQLNTFPEFSVAFFPLYDRRKGADAHNLNPDILRGLAETYGQTIGPEDLFDAILALLSATSYSVRFAEDLEDTFPHIPFPADPALFHRAVGIGREIRALESFARDPAAAFRLKEFCRLRSEACGPVGLTQGDDGEWFFCADVTGKFDGLPLRVWEFAVSGYRVLKRWADAREGLDGPTYWPQFRDVAARIHELLHWFDQADLVLAEVLEDTLSREELGLAAPVTEPDDD